jgi:threonine/homoserine/homoserine lactone efflux protein
VSTQLNYSLAPLTCGHSTLIVGLSAAALVLVALAGGILSWPVWQPFSSHSHAKHREENDRHSGAPRSGEPGIHNDRPGVMDSGSRPSASAGMTVEFQAARFAHAMFSDEDGRPHAFVAALGVLSAALFALVIAMQGAAALVLDGCMK